MGRAGISALAGVGRERENPRSERSEPAALKVQLGEVVPGNGTFFHGSAIRRFNACKPGNQLLMSFGVYRFIDDLLTRGVFPDEIVTMPVDFGSNWPGNKPAAAIWANI